MNQNQPQNRFTGAPALSPAGRPGPTPVQEPGPAAVYAPRATACLSVDRDGWVYLNAEAARQWPGTDGTADLRPPARRRDHWHLDARPNGPSNTAAVGTTGGLRFRAPERARALFAWFDNPTEQRLRFSIHPVTKALFRLIRQV